MRATIRPAILIWFAIAQLSGYAAVAASRPTHSPVRDSRRVIVSSHEAPHTRAGHQAATRGPARGHASENPKARHHGASAQSKAATGTRASRRLKSGSDMASVRHEKLAHRGRHSSPQPRAQAVRAEANVDATADRETLQRVHTWEMNQRPIAAPALLAAAEAEAGDTAVPGTDTIFAANLTPPTAVELPRVKSLEDEAATPVLLPSLYDKRGRLAVPAPLYGSHEVLLHQNLMADHDGLTRVRDDDDLLQLRRQGKLVPLPTGEMLHVDERLPTDRRYSRPWTADFLVVLSRDFFSVFHQPLQVNSAVRTVQIQQRLVRTNGNAAPVSGDTASPHLTGQAIDIGKRSLTMPQIAWMRAYLEPLIESGKIDVEEEFQQSCFHISVYKAYQAPPALMPHLNLAAAGQLHRTGAN